MEGNYISNRFPTPEEAEAGTITNPERLGKKQKTDKNEKGPSKVLERRFPGFTKNLYDYFIEYSSYTTIQGLRYVGEQSRSIFERLAWLIFFCVSLYFCINLIIKSYYKWDTSPVLISFATSLTPILKIPFPAVTICSQTKVRPSVYNLTNNYERMRDNPGNMTEEEIKHYADLAIICEYMSYQEGNLTTGNDTIEFLMKIAPEFNKTFEYCDYQISNQTCDELFTPILTEDGICHTFNMLNRSEIFRDNVYFFGDFMSHERESEGWTLEAGYKENTPISAYPKRSVGAGFEMQLTMFLTSNKAETDYICKGPEMGFKIILHNPSETPRLGINYIHAQPMQGIMITVKPDMITTSEELRSYDPHRRQCFFPEERYLAFYRSYTQANCEQECLANFTRIKCNCVGLHMPHEKATPICGSGSRKCMWDAKYELYRREAESIIHKKESNSNGFSGCDCLPGCTSIIYNSETSYTDLHDVEAWLKIQKIDQDPNILNTDVNVFFKEQQFMTSQRNELYGSTDFLASCGGLLGLFTGFSFLSLVEIFYFLSLRLFCNIKRYGKHYWSGSQDLINSDKYDHEK